MNNKKPRPSGIMLDVESLGNEGNFVVIQISLVPFSEGYIYSRDESLCIYLNVEDQLQKGFHINVDTVKWWMGSERVKTLGKLLSSPKKLSVKSAIIAVEEYLANYENVPVYASATLDWTGISNLSASAGLPNPINYLNRLCFRTIRFLYQSVNAPLVYEPTHDSYEDCVMQIQALFVYLNSINISVDTKQHKIKA